MQEIRAVTIFVFRIDKGQYYFYLVKRGKNIPNYPSTWTPIASIITEQDKELYEKLQKKHGDISENMQDKVVTLRLLLERNLIIDPEFNISLSASLDTRQQILELDQVHLNVLFHSMVPSGSRTLLMDEMNIIPHYYLFSSPASSPKKVTKLSQYSELLVGDKQIAEERGQWYRPSEIVSKREKMTELFDNSIATLMHHFYTEKKKLVDTVRKLEREKSQISMLKKGLLPFVWRFKTPAHTQKPFSESNIYVVGNQKKYIIDPGSTIKSNLADLTEFVDNNINTIEGILLTNYLVDHVNQAMFYKDKYDIPLFASRKTADSLEDEGYIFNSYLENGNKIDLGSYEQLGLKKWELETIDLPGYTDGQIGFYDPRGVAFVGSLFHRNMISAINSYPGAYSDLITSYNRLSKLKVKYALSGHRDMIIKPNELISYNLKQFSKLEPIVVQQLKSGQTSSEIIQEHVQNIANYKWLCLVRNVIQVILAKLIEENKVSKRAEDYFWLKNTIGDS
ncbi:MAG: MBL fold metallo-hydrolase [Candidatus Heimdallarchaeota archaeon]|nr:MBL fold metallo-hydrolase [Candidatus Heimdallarchaeota archaeon]